ncbi:hypothetical protein ACQEVM_19815 [Streptomyces sp. CA-243310]|uniref:hypothetical protein n=1 Tax=Streptomyces sp. CA-243310 TaxID=3240056 RepID=UPI003D8CE27E
MPLFRRAKKAAVPVDTGLPVPPWCPWFGPAEWQSFLALLNGLFLDGEGSDQPMRFGAEQHLQLGIGSGIPLDLAELALLLRPLPRAQWREAAAGHLNGLLELGDRRRALHEAGYEEVRPLLLPRVVPLSTVAEDFALVRPLTEDLAAVLVVRVDGDRSSPVPASQFRAWNVDGDEVWALAERNLAAEPVVRDESGAANPMVSVTCETGFTCTHVLRAGDLLGRPAPLGILAMVPHEGFLYFQAVDGPDLHSQLVGYSAVTLDNWEKAPPEQRLTSKVLWIHEGGIEAVGVEPAPAGGGRPGVITGSASFIAMLSSFRPPDPER